jgi:hypothetical protein
MVDTKSQIPSLREEDEEGIWVCVFCDAGHLYDGNGEISNIWSMRMELLFAKRTQCFRRQYGRQDLKWTGQVRSNSSAQTGGAQRDPHLARGTTNSGSRNESFDTLS